MAAAAVSSESPSQLCVNHLCKQYAERWVVNDVSFTVQAGQAVGLLGPNGAGKTTSFYAVVGVVQPTSGSITLDGQSLLDVPIHQRAALGLGYLAQDTSVFKGLSVQDNLRLVLEFQPLTLSQQSQRCTELLAEFGLEKLRHSMAISLSGGERRRLEIARALAANPRFLLLDEPFTGIDPITIEELQTLIIQLKAKGLGILMTDHNPQATLNIVDKAYVMVDGQVLFEGTKAEVAASPVVRQYYLGQEFQLLGT
jgi:lipopolysaccharide export system ATP-binding protein